MKPSSVCLEFLKAREGLRLCAYPDPASPLARCTPQQSRGWGYEPAASIIARLDAATRALSGAPWTIGWGETADVTQDMRISVHQADTLLENSMQTAWVDASSVITAQVTQGMCDAITSFVFNVGMGRVGVKDGFAVLRSGRPSTMLVRLNAGDYAGARNQILTWVYAGGVELRALKDRRAGEYALWGNTKIDFSNVAAGSATTAPGVVT